MRHEARKLTDRFLRSLKPAKPGDRDEYPDTVVQNFEARVTNAGTISLVLVARYPGSKHPARRKVGDFAPLSDDEQRSAREAYDALPLKERESLSFDEYLLREFGPTTLAAARAKALRWKNMIAAGRDPAQDEERKRQAELKKQEAAFPAVAEEYIKYVRRQKLRSVAQIERDLRTVFIPRWERRPVADISSDDIKRVIREAVERDAPYRAFKLHALIRRLFNWAIGTDDYGLERNPCDRLKMKDLVGERHSRKRVLNNDEIAAVWRVAGRIGYPWGPLYRVLLLSGLRLGEASGARWKGEFNLAEAVWVVPASRMKKTKGGANPHLVPLTDATLEVLRSLPRFASGDHVFSNSFGERPLKPDQMSDVKAKIDKRMLRALQALARKRGEDPKRVTLPHWVNHDLRRVVRSNLSALRVQEEVREAVLAHTRPGIKGVYDLYEYADEKREALTLWAARLRSIVEPPPANVVTLKARA